MRTKVQMLVMVVLGIAALDAAAQSSSVTVPAKDPSPTIYTRPTLVGSTQVVKVSVTTPSPNTPVYFKVYPETYGYRPTNSGCQKKFFTHYRRTNSAGHVVIRLEHPKPLCKGIIYQAETFIGDDVPDKFAHMCVRGRVSAENPTRCSDSL